MSYPIIEVTANDSVCYAFGHADWQGTGTAVEHASPEAWHSWFKSRFAHTRAHQDHLWKRLGDHVNSGLHPFISPDAYFRGLADLMAEGRIKVYALPPIKIPTQAVQSSAPDDDVRAQGPESVVVGADAGGPSADRGIATGSPGVNADEQQCLGDPVAPATGEEILTLDDFTVGAGMPLRWQRWYRSRFSDRNLGLGYGWFADCLRLIWQDEEATWLVDHEARAVKLPLLAPGEMAWHASGGQRLEHKTDSRMLLTEQDGRAWVFARDTQGQWRPTSVQNTLGQQWLFHYDDQQRLSRLDLSPSRRLLFGYGPGPNLQVVILQQGDEQQQLASYQYDSLGNLIQAKTPSGTERYGYDGHLLTQRTLATGYTFGFQWQGIGPQARCLRTCGEDGHHDYRFDYQPHHYLTRVIDAQGNLQIFHYDEQGRITARQDADGGVHQWTYDSRGHLVAYRLPDGRTTHYQFDTRGRPIRDRLPDGREHRRTFNDLGFCVAETLPDGSTYRRHIDPHGRLLRETRPDGSHWTYHYDQNGWLQRSVSDSGEVRRTGFNTEGQLLADEQRGDLTRYAFDPQGRVQGRLAHDLITEHVYQGDRLTAVHQYPEQAPQQKRSRHYGYDEAGRLNRFTTATGDTHGYQYDRLNRPVSYQRPDGHQVRYDYDKAERLTAVVRPDGSRWQLAYDSQGKVSHCDAPDGRRIELRYDAAGQVIHREQTGDWVQRLTRDAGGRVLQQLSQGRDRSPVSKQFQYDAYGRRSHASCAERQLAWTYDAYGNVSEHRQDQHRIGYEYGKGRRLQGLSLPDGTHVSYQYDEQGRWIGLQLNGQPALTRTLDDQGREISRDAGQNRQTQVWDRHQCLISRRWQGHTGETGLRRYTWDAESRLEAVADSLSGDTTYRRDPQGQLIAENDTAYHYDLGGNRITAHSQLQHDRLLETGDSHRQYDALGAETRVQQDSTEHRQYDAEGNLLSVRREGLYVQYGYDALGRRAWRKTEHGTTTYLWHQDVLLGEQNPEGHWQWYLRDPNTEEPLLTLIDGQPYYYELDHRMLPVRLWHRDGHSVWQGNADAWGYCQPDTPHGPIHQPIRLPGQFEDELTGLYNNRFRDYDPKTGRYLTPDPIGLKGGLNSYRYTKNPVDYIDPLGLSSCKTTGPTPEDAERGEEVAIADDTPELQTLHLAGAAALARAPVPTPALSPPLASPPPGLTGAVAANEATFATQRTLLSRAVTSASSALGLGTVAAGVGHLAMGPGHALRFRDARIETVDAPDGTTLEAWTVKPLTDVQKHDMIAEHMHTHYAEAYAREQANGMCTGELNDATREYFATRDAVLSMSPLNQREEIDQRMYHAWLAGGGNGTKEEWISQGRPSGLEGVGARAGVPNSTLNKKGLLNTEFSKDVLEYARSLEKHTGVRVHQAQRERLIENLKEVQYTRLSPEEGRLHRRGFTTKVKNQQIAEWEKQTGQTWPTYNEDIYNPETGKLWRSAGQKYDAHHIIENVYGGPHEWWNLHPASFPDQHQLGIHKDPIVDKIFE